MRRFNNDYYASGRPNDVSNSSSNNSSRDQNENGKFNNKNSHMGNYEKNASQMSMKRNDSDF